METLKEKMNKGSGVVLGIYKLGTIRTFGLCIPTQVRTSSEVLRCIGHKECTSEKVCKCAPLYTVCISTLVLLLIPP